MEPGLSGTGTCSTHYFSTHMLRIKQKANLTLILYTKSSNMCGTYKWFQLYVWLIVWTTGYTFLQIFVTFWDAHNWWNKCNSYAKGFPIDVIHEAVFGFKEAGLKLGVTTRSWGSCNQSISLSGLTHFPAFLDPHWPPAFYNLAKPAQWTSPGSPHHCRQTEGSRICYTCCGQVACGLLQEGVHPCIQGVWFILWWVYYHCIHSWPVC